MDGLAVGRVFQHSMLCMALLTGSAAAWAGNDTMTAVAAPHGPMLMIYVSQPLWSRGASRICGLRLQQTGRQPSLQSGAISAIAPPRSLIDLQLRRDADLRLEFGRRVTFDVRRGEFDIAGHQHSLNADLIATLH